MIDNNYQSNIHISLKNDIFKTLPLELSNQILHPKFLEARDLMAFSLTFKNAIQLIDSHNLKIAKTRIEGMPKAEVLAQRLINALKSFGDRGIGLYHAADETLLNMKTALFLFSKDANMQTNFFTTSQQSVRKIFNAALLENENFGIQHLIKIFTGTISKYDQLTAVLNEITLFIKKLN